MSDRWVDSREKFHLERGDHVFHLSGPTVATSSVVNLRTIFWGSVVVRTEYDNRK